MMELNLLPTRMGTKIILLYSLLFGATNACTNVLVTPGASEDGSSMIAYNSDTVTLFGCVYHYPPTSGKEGEMREVYSWDTGDFMGVIPEVNQTFNVAGNANENGVVIGETSFMGVPILTNNQPKAIMDYGSLMYIALQRSRTAREAIQIITSLMDTYGYASGGESFSIADGSEVWHMEIIGRGPDYGKLGAVWVALRIPDGYIGMHANQARITTFPRDDPDNCLYAEDVVDVAIHYGLYEGDGKDFSFSDVYCPLTPVNVRTDEARVWSIFSQFADDTDTFRREYHEYAAGRDLSRRMPVFIQPYRKLSVLDIMHAMADHFEGTEFDATKDVGSGLYGCPYRPRPLGWEYEGRKYHNERNVATFRTGFTFVAQVRSWMPRELSAVSWFAVDDASTTPRIPVFASSREISPPYSGPGAQDGNLTPVMTFDLTKAFWIQNMVSNLVYTRWKDIYPVVRAKVDGIQDELLEQLAKVDAVALGLYDKYGADKAVEYVTEFGVLVGKKMYDEWWKYYGELFVTYRDFFIIVPKEDDNHCRCKSTTEGLPDIIKQRVIAETGDHYLVAEPSGSNTA